MAAATFDDVISRLREEGQLDRNSGKNSLKSVKEAVLESKKEFKEGFGELLDFFQGNSLKDLEAKREQDEFNKDLLDALEGLGGKDNTPAPAAPAGTPGMGLGAIGGALALALGGIAGILTGQFKAIQTFAKLFTPDSLLKNLKGMRLGIAMQMDLFRQAVSERLASVRTTMAAGLNRIKTFFTISEESNIGKALARFKTALNTLIEPFRAAIGTITDLFKGGGAPSRLTSIFSNIGAYLRSFGSMVARVAGIVGKLFAPIAIVITLFDTIKGAIKGFIDDGIIGGLKGAVTGFFNSLIFGPLDMIKGAVAWVLGKFGLGKAEEALDSFSFADSFTKIVENLFYPFQWVQDKATEIVTGLTEWFSSKLDAVKNFFGFGRDDKEGELATESANARQSIRDAERRLATTRRAAEQGNVTINGRQATEEEINALIRRREQAVEQARASYVGAEAALEEFQNSSTLSDLLGDSITSIKDWISSTFEAIVESIKNFDVMGKLGNLGNVAADFFKGILRAVLPNPDVLTFDTPSVTILGKKLGGGTINLNPIPDSVYKFAGLDPATGGVLAPSGGGASVRQGAELAAAGAENSALAGQGAGSTIVSAPATTVQTVNNNQTTVEPAPAPAQQPEDKGGWWW